MSSRPIITKGRILSVGLNTCDTAVAVCRSRITARQARAWVIVARKTRRGALLILINWHARGCSGLSDGRLLWYCAVLHNWISSIRLSDVFFFSIQLHTQAFIKPLISRGYCFILTVCTSSRRSVAWPCAHNAENWFWIDSKMRNGQVPCCAMTALMNILICALNFSIVCRQWCCLSSGCWWF